MKKIVSLSIAAIAFSGVAMAQSATTDTVQSAVTQDYTFDLERTVDPSLAPLPADAGDYEAASPSEVETITSVTFDL